MKRYSDHQLSRYALTDAEVDRAIVLLRTVVVVMHHLPYKALPAAPDTLKGLRTALEQRGYLPIWGGGSDLTIYGTPELNHKFRAWHDTIHLALNAPMTDEGEARVCAVQQQQCYLHLNNADAWFAGQVLDAEIMGQLAHKNKYGEFPYDQEAMVRRYLLSGGKEL